MNKGNIPKKIGVIWASGPGSLFREVPDPSQIPVQNGAASFTDGFPPLNFTQIAAGGVPPFGQDMNGLMRRITQWSQWHQAGGPIFYDPTLQGQLVPRQGYPAGAEVTSLATSFLVWQSVGDDNTTNPDDPKTRAGWQVRRFPSQVGLTESLSVTGVSQDVTLDNGVVLKSSGAGIRFDGGAAAASSTVVPTTTPQKWIRVYNGILSVRNHNNTADILTLDDSGLLSVTSGISTSGSITAGTVNVISNVTAGGVTAFGDITAKVVPATSTSAEYGGHLAADRSVTAGVGITATTGDITATTGNVVLIAGNVNAEAGGVYGAAYLSTAGTVSGGTGVSATTGDIIAVAGDIAAPKGSVSAGATIIAGTGISTDKGDVVSTVGNVLANQHVVAQNGNISALLGTLFAAKGAMDNLSNPNAVPILKDFAVNTYSQGFVLYTPKFKIQLIHTLASTSTSAASTNTPISLLESFTTQCYGCFVQLSTTSPPDFTNVFSLSSEVSSKFQCVIHTGKTATDLGQQNVILIAFGD